MSTLTDYLDAVRDHLDAHELPPAASITVRTFDTVAVVQLDAEGLAAVASALLAWAGTLADVSAVAWRVPDGLSVHLDVCGALADGTRLRVFGGVRFDSAVFPDLQPHGRQSVGMTVLRGWTVDSVGVTA